MTVTCSTCNRAYRLITFPMFFNCNATHRTRTPRGCSNERPAPPGVNRGKLRPTAPAHLAHALVSGPVHSMFALTHSPATEHNSSFKVTGIRQRAHWHRTPSGGKVLRRDTTLRPRYIVNLPHHNRAHCPQTATLRPRYSEPPSSQQSHVAPKLPSAGSGPSGPLNKAY